MLAVESLIRARLATIPDVPGGVSSMSELSIEAISGHRFPALFVGSLGYRIEDAKSPGAVRVASQWIVVIATRHVADVRGGSGARAAAADLAKEVMRRLYRWQPAGYAPLTPTNPPKPEYVSGVLLFPMTFECLDIIDRSEL